MNESISKADWKDLMQRKGIDSLNDTMLHFYQVGLLCLLFSFLSFLISPYFLTLFFSLQSMAAINQTYLERNEESQRRMEATEASRVKEFAKINDENEELKCKLWDQVSLQALVNDYTAVTSKVSGLEAIAKVADERAI